MGNTHSRWQPFSTHLFHPTRRTPMHDALRPSSSITTSPWLPPLKRTAGRSGSPLLANGFDSSILLCGHLRKSHLSCASPRPTCFGAVDGCRWLPEFVNGPRTLVTTFPHSRSSTTSKHGVDDPKA